MYDNADSETSPEELLERVLATILRDLDLAAACTDADLPTLTDADGDPVAITDVHTFEHAGVLTLDRGVYLQLSDGSAYALTVGVSRRPSGGTELRSHRSRIRDAHRHQ